jgi:hypothetical protein
MPVALIVLATSQTSTEEIRVFSASPHTQELLPKLLQHVPSSLPIHSGGCHFRRPVAQHPQLWWGWVRSARSTEAPFKSLRSHLFSLGLQVGDLFHLHPKPLLHLPQYPPAHCLHTYHAEVPAGTSEEHLNKI